MSASVDYIIKRIKYNLAKLTNKMDEFFKILQVKVRILNLRRVQNEKRKNLGARVYYVMAVEKMKNPGDDHTVSELVVELGDLETKLDELNAKIKEIKQIKMEERRERAQMEMVAMDGRNSIKNRAKFSPVIFNERRQKMKGFFGFRQMVSTALIKFFYILGVIVLTIGGIVMLFQGGENALIGLGAIIFGNLVWRIICEGWILVFSIHDILGSIEQTLKEK